MKTATGGTAPTTGVLYRISGLLMSQGDTAGTISITTINEGANVFRLTARNANSTGAVQQATTTQDSAGIVVPIGPTQDSTCELEGLAIFSYVGPITLSVKLVTGAWCNILKGSHLVFTPLGTMTTIA
jgi:hypothetical protein